jgi:hypothetical protein
MLMNEKRPEKVLVKGETYVLKCPTCNGELQVLKSETSTTCYCGQKLNWGLRKN